MTPTMPHLRLVAHKCGDYWIRLRAIIHASKRFWILEGVRGYWSAERELAVFARTEFSRAAGVLKPLQRSMGVTLDCGTLQEHANGLGKYDLVMLIDVLEQRRIPSALAKPSLSYPQAA